MVTALIIGVSGQDGQYMTELLLSKGYNVIGTVRSTQQVSLGRNITNRISLLEWGMMSIASFKTLIDQHRPQEIYNFGAFSSGAGMYDDAPAIGEINGLAVAKILEAIRSLDPNIRFCQANSSEMFGDPMESPQTEQTPFRPRSPYGAAKLYAHWIVHIHRQRYGIFGCSAILFNHESPRRKTEFVSRKITRTAAAIKLGLANELRLGDLEARRDWGFAGDYVRAMWQMLQAEIADDYVVATGVTHSVRELCEYAFAHVGLNYTDYVRQDPTALRPAETTQLVGDPGKLGRELGWRPTVSFEQLIHLMVDADLEDLAPSNKRST